MWAWEHVKRGHEVKLYSCVQVRSGSDRSLIAAAFKGHVGVARVLLRNGEM